MGQRRFNPKPTDDGRLQDPKEYTIARTLDKKAFEEQRVFVQKERQGFGGGFKILEEYRRNKMKRRGDQLKADHEDEDEQKDSN